MNDHDPESARLDRIEKQIDKNREYIWDAELRIIGVILMVTTRSYWWWLGVFLFVFPTVVRGVVLFVKYWREGEEQPDQVNAKAEK